MSAEQELYGAVSRWQPGKRFGLPGVFEAAGRALAAGLDSPALRELAGASFEDGPGRIGELVSTSFEELDLPRLGTVPPGFVVAAGGEVVRRQGIDSLRLEVAPTPSTKGRGFQVLVHVNEAELTSAGAGLGLEPYQLFIPTNGLMATSQSRTVPIARCGCTFYECSGTDVTIVRDDDVVHWEWSRYVPMNRGVSFPAAEYDIEVARVAADLSWEPFIRIPERLVLTNVDRDHLLAHGLTVDYVINMPKAESFHLSLAIEDDYQVFVNVPWGGRGPGELAEAVCATLARPPHEWQATWHAVRYENTEPPAIAGPAWQREQLPN